MSLYAGVARVELDPSLGLPMPGYPHLNLQLSDVPVGTAGYFGRQGVATGTHDPLYARTLVLQNEGQNGSQTLVIIALDLIVVTQSFTDVVRKAITEATGIQPDRIMLAASHTHSGPDLFNWEGQTPATAFAEAAAKIVECVCLANAARKPARLGFQNGLLEAVTINRREDAGPIDPKLGVLTVVDEQEMPMAIVVNFAIHPIVLSATNLDYSGDIPGAVSASLERVYPNAVALFLNGAAGNINPVAYVWAKPKENIIPVFRAAWHKGLPHPRTSRNLVRLGNLIAAEAMRLLESTSSYDDNPPLYGASKEAHLPLRLPAELEKFRAFKGPRNRAGEVGDVEDNFVTEVQAFAIGTTLYVAVPCELFVELGLLLQERLSPANTYIVGFANDDARYILPSDAYRDNSYENWSSMFVAGSGELLIEAAEEVARSVQRALIGASA